VGARELVPDLTVARPDQVRRVWLVRGHDRPVGRIVASVHVAGANTGLAELEVAVRPGSAGAGVEEALVAASLPWLGEVGARSVAWWVDDEPSRAVAERLGLTFRQQERCSRLRVEDVDDDQQASWVAAPAARAAGYRLVTWTGPCPDEHLDAYAAACSAMADAPLDGVEYAVEPVTPERVRRREALGAELGRVGYTALVLDARGNGAGMTAIDVHPDRPRLAQQEDTAVVGAHRGHGLGRWLKAANLRQVRDAVPELGVVETYNAESNPWMLAINVDMGFRPHRSFRAHQGPVAEVVARLAAGVDAPRG
jgi:GNAT superfamily N-acetyltransferase